MLPICAVASAALLVGSPVRVGPARAGTPEMMQFIKDMFPNLEKPDFNFGGSPPAPPIEVKEPSAAITAAGKGMPLLSPIFNIEADIQAAVLNLGSYDEEAIRDEISATSTSAPVVIYTYPLSPFSSEAVAVLESSGCKFEEVQLGLEWFALGPKGSATRVELRKLYGQGSLPHIFIGGEWVGGLATGADDGLAGLVESGELEAKLRKAKAL